MPEKFHIASLNDENQLGMIEVVDVCLSLKYYFLIYTVCTQTSILAAVAETFAKAKDFNLGLDPTKK